jgi:hypothetical protein
MNFGCSKEEEEVPETAIQKKTRRGEYECWCGFVLLHDGMVLYIGQAMVGRSKKRSILLLRSLFQFQGARAS